MHGTKYKAVHNAVVLKSGTLPGMGDRYAKLKSPKYDTSGKISDATIAIGHLKIV